MTETANIPVTHQWKRAALSFVAIAALAFVIRLNLATIVRPCLNGEEAVAGVMAQNIEEKGEHPIFTYLGAYNGGVSMEAHAAAALNALLGRSALNVRLSTIICFALFAGVATLLGMRAVGPLPGIFVGLHIVFSPQFYNSSQLALGYMEVFFLMSLCCLLVFSRMMGGEPGAAAKGQSPPPLAWGALLGLLTGIAWWGVEFSAMMTAALFAAYGLRWRKRALPALLAWAVFFPLGAVPTIIYNLNHDFLNFRHLLRGHLGTETTFAQLFTKELPSLFQNDNLSLYLHAAPWSAWLLFAVTGIGCLPAIFFSVRNRNSGAGILTFGLLYCLFYITMYLSSPFRGESPRHLLPLEPFLSIGLAAGITALVRTRAAAARLLAAVLIAAVIAADAAGALYAMKDDTVDLLRDMDVKCDTAYDRIDHMVEILEANGIKHVYTNRYLKWMILYRTEQKITAADVNLPPGALAWGEYEDAASAADRVAFYLGENEPTAQWLRAYLGARGIPYRYMVMDHYILISPAARVSSVDFINWSKRMYETRARRAVPADSP